MRRESSFGQIISLIGLLVLAVAAAIAFQADVLKLSFFQSKPQYGSALLDSISVKGSVKVKDLKLSSSEIRTMNFAALKHNKVFPKVDLTINMADQFAPVVVKNDTELLFGLGLKAPDSEVVFYNRTVERRDIVPFMVRSMEKAVDEFLHYKETPQRNAPLKRLYM